MRESRVDKKTEDLVRKRVARDMAEPVQDQGLDYKALLDPKPNQLVYFEDESLTDYTDKMLRRIVIPVFFDNGFLSVADSVAANKEINRDFSYVKPFLPEEVRLINRVLSDLNGDQEIGRMYRFQWVNIDPYAAQLPKLMPNLLCISKHALTHLYKGNEGGSFIIDAFNNNILRTIDFTPAIFQNQDFARYVIMHELSHMFGLKHTRHDSREEVGKLEWSPDNVSSNPKNSVMITTSPDKRPSWLDGCINAYIMQTFLDNPEVQYTDSRMTVRPGRTPIIKGHNHPANPEAHDCYARLPQMPTMYDRSAITDKYEEVLYPSKYEDFSHSHMIEADITADNTKDQNNLQAVFVTIAILLASYIGHRIWKESSSRDKDETPMARRVRDAQEESRATNNKSR